MIMKILPVIVSVSLLLSLRALGGEGPPETVKQAILRTIELSAEQHVFGQRGEKGAEKGSTSYLDVNIRGRILTDRSIKVVLSLLAPRRGSETTDAFSVDFSASGIRTEPVQSVPVIPGLILEDERKICKAVKAVMAEYLSEKKTEVSLNVYVTQKNQECVITVCPLPLMVGDHRTFIVNKENEIKDEWGGR